MKLIAGLWLVSVVAARDLTTFKKLSNLHYLTIQDMHKRVLRFKYRALALSAGLHLLALGMLTWVYSR